MTLTSGTAASTRWSAPASPVRPGRLRRQRSRWLARRAISRLASAGISHVVRIGTSLRNRTATAAMMRAADADPEGRRDRQREGLVDARDDVGMNGATNCLELGRRAGQDRVGPGRRRRSGRSLPPRCCCEPGRRPAAARPPQPAGPGSPRSAGWRRSCRRWSGRPCRRSAGRTSGCSRRRRPRACDTAFWTISVNTANDGPMPSPAMTIQSHRTGRSVLAWRLVSRNRPTASVHQRPEDQQLVAAGSRHDLARQRGADDQRASSGSRL